MMIFFPFAPTVLNFLHKLHVIEPFSSLFSTAVATDFLFATMGQTDKVGDQIFLSSFCVPSLSFSVDSVDIYCCFSQKK